MFETKTMITAAFSALMLTSPAQAELQVNFIEGAPKDRFQIENTGACAYTGGTLQLDLAGSQGGLVFDVTAAGAGVEVFQPFEIVAGRKALVDAPSVVDGQTAVALNIKSLAPGDAIVFTTDIDDTLGGREITVNGSEIAGATVSHMFNKTQNTATFSTDSTAKIMGSSC